MDYANWLHWWNEDGVFVFMKWFLLVIMILSIIIKWKDIRAWFHVFMTDGSVEQIGYRGLFLALGYLTMMLGAFIWTYTGIEGNNWILWIYYTGVCFMIVGIFCLNSD